MTYDRSVSARDRLRGSGTARAVLGADWSTPRDGLLEALGATLVSVNSPDGLNHYGVNMRDPEGNEFDIAYGRRDGPD